MKLQIRVNGDLELRRKVANVAECAVAGTLTRRGLTQVGQIVTRTQKRMAPILKGRIKARQLKRRLVRGMEIGKAIRLSTVFPRRVRKLKPDFIGPPREIKPGLVRRSIGFRVLRLGEKGDKYFVVKMGMNVGKKRSNNNFAPHAAFVGLGTVQRAVKSWRGIPLQGEQADRGIMPKNRFIADATNVAAPAAMAALDKAVKEDTVRAYKLSLRASRGVQ